MIYIISIINLRGENKMIKHVVFFKMKNKCDIQEMKNMLLGMDGRIEELKYIEVGVNFKDSARSYDICLITHFDTKEDLEIYANHEVHMPVKEYASGACESVVAVDFEG